MDKLTEGTAPDKVPALVLALAQQAAIDRVPNPIPIKWRDEGDSIYVQFEDGRALHFDKWENPPEVRPAVETITSVFGDANWRKTVDEANANAKAGSIAEFERKKKK